MNAQQLNEKLRINLVVADSLEKSHIVSFCEFSSSACSQTRVRGGEFLELEQQPHAAEALRLSHLVLSLD